MFTLEQIKTAHAQVKSGADFPRYIQELKVLGVASYETFVTDGHTEYLGNPAPLSSPARYEPLRIAATPNTQQLQNDLKLHQQGQSDYPTFCRQAAASGAEKWTVNIGEMSCTYLDKAGNSLLVETIPGVKG